MKQAKPSPVTQPPHQVDGTVSSNKSKKAAGKSPVSDTLEFDFGGSDAPFKPIVIKVESKPAEKLPVATVAAAPEEEKKVRLMTPSTPEPEPVKSSVVSLASETPAKKKIAPSKSKITPTYNAAPISSREHFTPRPEKTVSSAPTETFQAPKTAATLHSTHITHSAVSSTVSSSHIPTSTASTGITEPTSTRIHTMATNPPTVSDFRKNAERQAKEQHAVGNVLAWVGYSLLGAVILFALLASFGGYTLYEMIQRQSVTVAQLDARYTDQLNKQQADLAQLRAETDKLTDQLSAVANLMAKQQEQLKRTAAAVDDANNNLKARAHDISDLKDRVRHLEGTRSTTVIR